MQPDEFPMRQDTPAEAAEMKKKQDRLAIILEAYWLVHGYPETEAEGISQANHLYHQIYGVTDSWQPAGAA